MRSLSNFQVTSYRFMNSCIVKCNTGKEVKKFAQINFASEDEVKIITREGADLNKKALRVQI